MSNDTVTQIVRETPAGAITATFGGDTPYPSIDISINGIHAGIFEYNSETNRFGLYVSSQDFDAYNEPLFHVSLFPETIDFMGYKYPCRYLEVPIKVEDEIELHSYTIITPDLDEMIQGLIKDEDPEGLDWLDEKYWVVENQGLSDEEIIEQIQRMNSD
jgi:hypothetical protein